MLTHIDKNHQQCKTLPTHKMPHIPHMEHKSCHHLQISLCMYRQDWNSHDLSRRILKGKLEEEKSKLMVFTNFLPSLFASIPSSAEL